MMEKDQYIRQLLQKWLGGETGYKEERELGSLAQDDPFLNDALEGYQQFPEGKHQEKLALLRQALQTGKRKNRMAYWRVAAGVAIIVVAVFALQNLNKSDLGQLSEELNNKAEETSPLPPSPTIITENEAVLNKEHAAVEELASVKEAPHTPKESKNKVTDKTPEQSNKRSRLVSPLPENKPAIEEEAAAVAASTQRATSLNKGDEMAAPKPAADVALAEDQTAPTPISNTAKESAADDLAMKKEAIQSHAFQDASAGSKPSAPSAPIPAQSTIRQISGQVTDENGAPLIGATVNVPGTPIGTVTDLEGRYVLPLTTEKEELQFSYIGFESTKIQLVQNDTYNIRLQDSGAVLDEVVVSGYGVGKKKAKPAEKSKNSKSIKAKSVEVISSVGALLQGGIKQLDRTIQQQAIPLIGNPEWQGKSVSVIFTLNADGSLSDFIISESLSPVCDAEAIRLIKLTTWQLNPSTKVGRARISCKVWF
ncbi:MAG: carboxypeptidase-like regulatory domain-containing protein [Saprospiraceae bacterium]